jgi:hypothetical protein
MDSNASRTAAALVQQTPRKIDAGSRMDSRFVNQAGSKTKVPRRSSPKATFRLVEKFTGHVPHRRDWLQDANYCRLNTNITLRMGAWGH